MRVGAALLGAATLGVAQAETVLVTGASGHSGRLVYSKLRAAGYDVRGLVRNQTYAREVLNCTKCDPSEGIYVADVTVPNSTQFQDAFRDVDRVVITTGAGGKWKGIPYLSPYEYIGGTPQEIDFVGTQNQVTALMSNTAASRPRHVLFYSTPFTTEPDNFLDRLGKCNGKSCASTYFKLNAEAFILQAQVPYSIFKICGLADGPAGQSELLWGHDDKGYPGMKDTTIAREDVADLVVLAVQNPNLGNGLRFDLCSKAGQPPTDLAAFLKETRYPWQQ